MPHFLLGSLGSLGLARSPPHPGPPPQWQSRQARQADDQESYVLCCRAPPPWSPSPAYRSGPRRQTSGDATPSEGHTWGDRVAVSTACWSSGLRLKCRDAQNRCLGDKDIGCYLNDN